MAKEVVSDVEVEVEVGIDNPSRLSDEEKQRGNRDYWRIAAAVLIFVSLLWWSCPRTWFTPCKGPSLKLETAAVIPGDDAPNIGFPESVLWNWGQYAPYIPVAKYIPPPPGCVVNQVSLRQFSVPPDLQLTKPCLR
jgi:hypothetical protein